MNFAIDLAWYRPYFEPNEVNGISAAMQLDGILVDRVDECDHV